MTQSVKGIRAIGYFFKTRFANNTNTYLKTEINQIIDESINSFKLDFVNKSDFDANTEKVDEIKKGFEELKKQVKKLKPKEEPKASWMSIFMFAILLVLSIVIICFLAIDNSNVVYPSAAITFIGILATFVVISNYMQLKQTEDKLQKLSEHIDKIENKVNSYDEYENIRIIENKIEKIERRINISSYRRGINSNLLIGFIYFKNKKYADALDYFMGSMDLLNEFNKIKGCSSSYEYVILCIEILKDFERDIKIYDYKKDEYNRILDDYYYKEEGEDKVRNFISRLSVISE